MIGRAGLELNRFRNVIPRDVRIIQFPGQLATGNSRKGFAAGRERKHAQRTNDDSAHIDCNPIRPD